MIRINFPLSSWGSILTTQRQKRVDWVLNLDLNFNWSYQMQRRRWPGRRYTLKPENCETVLSAKKCISCHKNLPTTGLLRLKQWCNPFLGINRSILSLKSSYLTLLMWFLSEWEMLCIKKTEWDRWTSVTVINLWGCHWSPVSGRYTSA